VFLRIPPQDYFLFGPLLFSVFHPSRALKSGQSRHLARTLGYRRSHAARLRGEFSPHSTPIFSPYSTSSAYLEIQVSATKRTSYTPFALGAPSFKAYLSFPDLFAERTDSEINVNSRHTKVPVGFWMPRPSTTSTLISASTR
jgi:hypothetical protein